ncbi:Lys48-specific deubiquitinase Ubp14 [Schizosaccharomyces pombe]|uniref:Ubiquitin carboxyl-terminal hydrolase 14 n=1 Tax=Schizosaccharomyces pombe (strain 972 / ATCC 24843) TaxID=284812 RepID=UBP14_SCHPO|nr:ubiquitin hydrolase Ubp14 [Schizosaccharomyces pombe]Q11119.2 RecName: Full=Ubiquitin carboxyl-terminal hydrolase 14; AltName: Full=Deubiquitinating enzyme 14; AltName: Full=UBA domain-containing protein 2; AltName: Full=Ubiquitin thioesterase 14; AltName: Full=Ubiquitin-specific-processing protease 14 [Schizosaccharomyces pombe 972h-]CAA17049.1 ubiquitin C-terminal hydrolase Ubp14 [Schizosaccharomyces pombe]|eukprot:NP_596085.1 ubiquitin hydrolase Ubp14 [Schizosaccharomyces pombe]
MSCPHLTETNVVIPDNSQVIYREECVRCFNSQDEEGGIDLCLTCFQSGCGETGLKHSLVHFEQTLHPIVVTIARQPKQKINDEPPQKITKLEIREDSDEDLYDYFYVPKCLVCNIILDIQDPLLSLSLEAMKNATKASNKSQLTAWENELTTCDHIINLPENETYVTNLDNATCSKCDLAENLWMCLTCGALSCGRKQYGGGGGNGHALSHYDDTGHPLAVKLKSISPDGQADIYCYSCDEERIDPNIKTHMLNFGIDIAKLNKTEKSLAELQLEQNLNWDFGASEEDDASKRLFGPGLTGLKNLGNSCYLASTMQSLFSIKEFAIHELNLFNTYNSVCQTPTTDLQCQLGKLADGLVSGKFSKPSKIGLLNNPSSSILPYQDGLRPFMFKDVVGQGHSEFGTSQQQDAYEFLLYLLGKIRKSSIAKTDITKIFDFETEQKLSCLSCKRVRYSSFSSQGLTLTVPRVKIGEIEGEQIYEEVSIDQCLDATIQPDQMEYTCEACKSKLGATTTTAMKSFPKVLILQANRFDLQGYQVKKLSIPIIVNEDGIYNFDRLMAKDHPNDEDYLPEKTETIEWNQSAIEQLQAMGFPLVRCQRALLATGNSDTETAMNWLFEHMEDPEIDKPIEVSELLPKADSSVSEENVQSLCEFGFTVAQARKGLLESNNNIERAVDWILNHPDESFEEPPLEGSDSSIKNENMGSWESTNVPVNYNLKAIISHKGSSAHAGHYVAFIRKEIDGKQQWVLFNDEKVLQVASLEEAKTTGYVYLFERLD